MASRQPRAPQPQRRPARADDHVPELARLSRDAAHGLAADERHRRDAGADDHDERVLEVGGGAAHGLAGRGHVVVDPDRQAEPGRDRPGHVEVGAPRG